MSDKVSVSSDSEGDTNKGDENLPPSRDTGMDKYGQSERDNVERSKSENVVGKMKQESKDDIKNFAEDTMNELLGWYGYEKAADGSIDRKLLKRGGTTFLEKQRAVHVTPKTKYDMDYSNESNDSCGDEPRKEHEVVSQVNYKDINPSDLEQIQECSERSFVVCTWCQKGKTLDKHFVMSTNQGDRKFCSEQCFDHSRRDKYKKQKLCEWCKNPCSGSKCVEFEDGDEIFLFCSENCLNKYKMNIFCQETQEHMKKADTAAPNVSLPVNTSASRILITPELWTEEIARESQSAAWNGGNERIAASSEMTSSHKSLMRAMPLQERSRHKNKMATAAANHVTANMATTANDNDTLLRVVALKAKAELEHPKSTRQSNNARPPRMTDREKIKQIRMRDRLPLHTPLRETYRNQNSTDNPYDPTGNVTHSVHSPVSSTSGGFNAHALLRSSKPVTSATLSQMQPLSAGQLFGGAYVPSNIGTRNTMSSHSISPKLERGSIRDNCDSTSSQSTSPRLSSSEMGGNDSTPAPPPLYPPPNPFTHALPSFFNNLPGGPLGFPTAPGLASLSALSALYPPPFMPPPAMPNLVPPNTFMVPYPFPLPLPIPIPIPIPIPQKVVDSIMKNKTTGDANQTGSSDSKDNVFGNNCKNGCSNSSRSQRGSDNRTPCSLCTSSGKVLKQEPTLGRSTSPSSLQRYFLESVAKKATESSIVNDGAIDLSTDSSNRYRHRSLSPAPPSSRLPNATTPNLHPNTVVIQPTSDTGSDLSPTGPPPSGASPPPPPFPVSFNHLAAQAPAAANPSTNARYSSRRSLILDAPASSSAAIATEHAHAQQRSSSSPETAAEKRSYHGPSVRDILYGKRKCSRPRIKTK